jgi:hypothetical protein
LARGDCGVKLVSYPAAEEQLTAHLNREIKMWRVVFKKQGIKAE